MPPRNQSQYHAANLPSEASGAVSPGRGHKLAHGHSQHSLPYSAKAVGALWVGQEEGPISGDWGRAAPAPAPPSHSELCCVLVGGGVGYANVGPRGQTGLMSLSLQQPGLGSPSLSRCLKTSSPTWWAAPGPKTHLRCPHPHLGAHSTAHLVLMDVHRALPMGVRTGEPSYTPAHTQTHTRTGTWAHTHGERAGQSLD